MGKQARISLILTAAACLVAVMVDWVVSELSEGSGADPVAGPGPVGPVTAAEANQPAGE